MAKLISQEVNLPGVVKKTWLHTDGMGNDNISVEMVQDVSPIFKDVERSAKNSSKDMPLIAKIPSVLVEQTARECAKIWGVSLKKVFEEIMASEHNQTDRAKVFWTVLCQGRDYRKLQAKHYI